MDGQVFHANICSVCQVTRLQKPLKSCKNCKMVSYCTTEHQKQHWRKHKKLCLVIQQVKTINFGNSFESKKDWYNFRTRFMMMCEMIGKKKLESDEVKMLLFPRTCEVCHSVETLTDCRDCLSVSYCSDQHRLIDEEFHKKYCSQLKLCLDVDLVSTNPLEHLIHKWNLNCHLTSDMETFLTEFVTCQTSSSPQTRAILSEYFTCPLTAASVLTTLDNPRLCTIHILGPTWLEIVDTIINPDSEASTLWELLLHLTNIQSLDIHFIGPEVIKPLNLNINLCTNCQRNNKNITLKFSKLLYHKFRLKNSKIPDRIFIFNCGLHEFDGSEEDTWKDSLRILVESNTPIVLTSFTEEEAKMDVKRLVDIDGKMSFKTEENVFKSLRPHRDLESLGVYYNNQVVSVYVPRR